MNLNLNSKKTKWMYLACGLILLAGLTAFAFLMIAAQEMIQGNAFMAQHARGVCLYILGAAIPCVLAMGMLVAVIYEIGEERAFTARNAGWMRGIAAMAFLECAYILAGLFGWSMIGLMHPGVMILALAVMMLGAGVGLLAWALGGLVQKASVIQQENDLTV